MDIQTPFQSPSQVSRSYLFRLELDPRNSSGFTHKISAPYNLGTLVLNRVTLTRDDPHEFELLARTTPLKREVFALLGVELARTDSSRPTV